MPSIEQAFVLAQRNHQAGAFREAEIVYRQILAAQPAFAPAWHALGTLQMGCGKIQEGIEFIARAIALSPASEQFHFDLGVAYESMGNLQRAAASFEAAGRLRACFPEAHHNLAVCCQRLGNFAGAQKHCSIALQQKSDYADAWNHQALLWLMAKRLEDALAAVEIALRLDPDHSSAHNHRAVALQLLGRKDAAVESYRRALALNPNFAQAHSNLAALLQDQGKLDEAEEHLRLAVQLNPGFAAAWTNLAAVLQLEGKIDEAIAHFRKAVSLAPGDATLFSNYLFCLNYDGKIDSPTMLAEHRRWESAFGRGGETHSYTSHDRNPDRPLRIGYVSSDFCEHAAAHFLQPVLANHNPAAVHVTCYANVISPDAVTERFKSLAHEWRPIQALSDADAANQIRADRIDILVDLSGHTAASRLTVFAHKPAPIQASWLGYPSTTGLAAIDYYLSDPIADPPAADSDYVEKLIRLPHGFACFNPPSDAPTVNALPAARNGFITFGSLHGIARLNHAVIDTWCDILRSIPSAHLLLFRNTLRGKVQDDLFGYIARQGVAPHRLEFRHSVRGPGGYLSVYHDIDISLDTFPWSGHTTACQSLWMGVPVVTLAGPRHAGRMAASVLHHMGLEKLVADSREKYVEIAINLAANIGDLTSMRSNLRAKMLTSPVCDNKGFTACLEDAYRAMWRCWISG